MVDLINIEEYLDPNKVRDVQREIEIKRRNDLQEQKEKDDEMARLERNLRAHERSMQTQKVKRGRKLVKRSAKPYQRKKAIVTDKKLNIDDKDDDSYYFKSYVVWTDHHMTRDTGKLSIYKVGCIFRTVISSEFRMERHRDGGHREDAPHFTFPRNLVVSFETPSFRTRGCNF